MDIDTRDLCRERVRVDSEALRHTQTRIADLHRLKAYSEAQLASLQTKLIAISTELQHATKRERALTDSLADARAALVRVAVAQLPEDILHVIFDQLNAEPDPLWDDSNFGEGEHNRDRASLPFTLATVCSRWRRLVIARSNLWTYISCPVWQAEQHHPDRLRVRVERAKRQPLDILLPWRDCEEVTAADTLLSTLIRPRAWQWRRVEIHIPSFIDTPHTMDMFRMPTPLLTHLHVSSANDNLETEHEHLPMAPRLQMLSLEMRILCSTYDGPWPALTSLSLHNGYLISQVVDMLKKCSTTVTSLTLCILEDPDAAPLLTTIDLPALESLSLRTALPSDNSAFFTAPKLHSLTLEDGALTQSLRPLLAACHKTITSLTLGGCDPGIGGPSLDYLKTLSNITHLAFRSLPLSEVGYYIYDDFFEELCADGGDATVWPKLRSIRMYEDGDYCQAENGNLVKFIQRRNFSSGSCGGGGGGRRSDSQDDKVQKIVEVILDCDEVPGWMHDAVQGLLDVDAYVC